MTPNPKLAELVDGVKGSWISIHAAVKEAYALGKEDQYLHGEHKSAVSYDEGYAKGRTDENEECAKIVATRRGLKPFAEMTMWEDGAASACDAIAEQIRARQTRGINAVEERGV